MKEKPMKQENLKLKSSKSLVGKTSGTKPSEEYLKEKKKPKAENSELPLVSVIKDKSDMKKAIDLLKDISNYSKTEKEYKKAKDDAIAALAAIAIENDLKGVRYGTLGLHVFGYKTKMTLSPELLLANGVKASVIESSYKESDEFLSTRFQEFEQ